MTNPKQAPLFGQPIPVDIQEDLTQTFLPKSLRQMHAAFGATVDQQCKNCKSFLRLNIHNKTYFKCARYKVTSGPATDWRAGWQACGKFETVEEDRD